MDLELELQRHKEATIRAIESGRTALVERRLEAYVEFAKSFLDAAKKQGVIFTAEAAKSISLLEWPTVINIERGVWESVAAGVKSNNREIVSAATQLPARLLEMSVAQNDFLFFLSSIKQYRHMLSLAYSPDRMDTQSFIIDRCWRYLKEFADYILVRNIKNYEEPEQTAYATNILSAFSELLKVSMDQEDIETFGLLAREFNSLFSDFTLEYHSVENLKIAVEAERLNIWFALGAWLLRSFVSSETEITPGLPNQKIVAPEAIGGFFEIVAPNFKNMRQLSDTFLRTHDERMRGAHWENWLWETLTSGEVHSIDFGRWLTWFYTVQGLRLSWKQSQGALDFPVAHIDLQHRLGELERNVQSVKDEKSKWVSLFPQLEEEEMTLEGSTATPVGLDKASENFLMANRIAIQEWQRTRDDDIINSDLDDERLATYKAESIKGWNESGWVLRLFSEFGRVQESNAEEGETYTAFNILMAKEPFITDRIVHYVGFGRDHGNQLGRDLSDQLVRELVESSSQREASTIDSIINNPEALLSEDFDTAGTTAMVVWGGFNIEREFLAHKDFVPVWQELDPLFERGVYLGRLKGAPVFFIHNENTPQVLFLALGQACSLVHYVPVKDNYDGLLIRITEIDESEASRIFDAWPDIALDENGSPLPREEEIRKLQLRAGVFVGAKIELKIDDQSGIQLIPIIHG